MVFVVQVVQRLMETRPGDVGGGGPEAGSGGPKTFFGGQARNIITLCSLTHHITVV